MEMEEQNMMPPLVREPWFMQLQTKAVTVEGVIGALAEMYEQHPERWIDGSQFWSGGAVWPSDPADVRRCCAIGAISALCGFKDGTTGSSYLYNPLEMRVVESLSRGLGYEAGSPLSSSYGCRLAQFSNERGAAEMVRLCRETLTRIAAKGAVRYEH